MGSLTSTLLVASFVMARALAQTEINSGDLAGTLRVKDGAPIPAAVINVRDSTRGLSRIAVSDDSGNFRVLRLAPALYEAEISCPACARTVIKDIQIQVGETLNLEIDIERASEIPSISFVVDVTAKPPVIETYRSQQANAVDEVRLRNLPINRRNYLDFALLSPGVVDSTSLADDNDFRVAQAPQSGLSIGGNNGRGNAFAIDGISADYNSGGWRPSIGQEAVQEFQINRSSFSAEFGGASGGAINIVSRSGSNQFHADVFGLLRQRSLQARNYFDSANSPYTRGQYGGTFGGPLTRNKTFFFAAFEQLTSHETVFVPLLNSSSAFNSLTPPESLLANYFSSSGSSSQSGLGGALNQLLIPNNFPATVALFQHNSGNIPFSEQLTQASLRLDHHFSNRLTGFLRTNFTGSTADRTQFGAQIAANRGRSNAQQDATVMASSVWIPNSRWSVETLLGLGYNDFLLRPADPYGPEVNIDGYGYFGRDIYLPSRDLERSWEARQDWTWFAGKHVIKFGANFQNVRDSIVTDTMFGGQFDFGSAIPLGSLLDTLTRNPNFATNLANGFAASGNTALAAAVATPITALQSYDLGLPDFYQQGFGQPAWIGSSRRLNTFVQDSWALTPALKLDFGLRYELELNTGPIRDSLVNFAPRFGFAWSPLRRTVVRGGFGLFFAPINAQFPYIAEIFGEQKIYTTLVPLTGFPGVINPATGQPVTSADIYQTLLAKGVIGNRTILPSDLHQFGLFPTPGVPLGARFSVDPDFKHPYSEQASLEIERALGNWTISAAYNFNRGVHIARAIDINIIQAGTNPDGTPIYGFRDPTLLQNNSYQSTANSYYHAGIFQVTRRLSHLTTFNVHYTWSKSIDDLDDFIAAYEPNDQLDARAERGLSPFNQKHRLGANFVVQTPEGRGPGLWPGIFRSLTFSGIVLAHSATPFNLLVGYDNVGDNHPDTHRPVGAGRNIGIGPDFFSADFRLSREFRPLRDSRWSMLVSAEMFNAFNRTNFRSVNNIVGNVTLSELPPSPDGQPRACHQPASLHIRVRSSPGSARAQDRILTRLPFRPLPYAVFGVHGIGPVKRDCRNLAYGRHLGQVDQRIYRPDKWHYRRPFSLRAGRRSAGDEGSRSRWFRKHAP